MRVYIEGGSRSWLGLHVDEGLLTGEKRKHYSERDGCKCDESKRRE